MKRDGALLWRACGVLAVILLTGFAMAACDSDSASECDISGYHVWGDWGVTIPATCGGEGVEARRCERCDELDTRRVFAPGHDLVFEVTGYVTCTEDGERIETCQREGCDHSVVVSVWRLGHDWTEWYVLVEASYYGHGEKTRDCLRCGYVYAQRIPSYLVGHCGCGIDCCVTFDDCHLAYCFIAADCNPDLCIPDG